MNKEYTATLSLSWVNAKKKLNEVLQYSYIKQQNTLLDILEEPILYGNMWFRLILTRETTEPERYVFNQVRETLLGVKPL